MAKNQTYRLKTYKDELISHNSEIEEIGKEVIKESLTNGNGKKCNIKKESMTIIAS